MPPLIQQGQGKAFKRMMKKAEMKTSMAISKAKYEKALAEHAKKNGEMKSAMASSKARYEKAIAAHKKKKRQKDGYYKDGVFHPAQ